MVMNWHYTVIEVKDELKNYKKSKFCMKLENNILEWYHNDTMMFSKHLTKKHNKKHIVDLIMKNILLQWQKIVNISIT